MSDIDVLDEIRRTHEWLDCRELPQIPPYFTIVSLEHSPKIIADLRKWIYTNTQGRFAFGSRSTTHSSKNQGFDLYKTIKVVGFEYQTDATFFSLTFL